MILTTELARLFLDTPIPEAPAMIDLGHPLQHHDEPEAFDYDLTQNDRTNAASFAVQLERLRRERNKRDADREIAKLGVVFTDGDQS